MLPVYGSLRFTCAIFDVEVEASVERELGGLGCSDGVPLSRLAMLKRSLNIARLKLGWASHLHCSRKSVSKKEGGVFRS